MNISCVQNSAFFLLLLIVPVTALSSELSTPAEKEQKTIIKPQRKPVLIEADRITGYYKQEMEATGNVELRYGDNVLTADRMKYYQMTEDTEVEGNACLERPKDTLKGKYLELNLRTEEGHMSDPRYYIKDGKGRGAGSLLLFEGKNNYRLKDANYTTCAEGSHDWYIRAKELEIDNKKEIGTARHVSVVFKDVPILYSPWIDFSYSGKRKTGLLAPVAGYNVRTGFDVALPVYLNIAPNIDATVAPRIMTERGFLLSNELRYIGPHNMNGHLLFDILPMDINTNQTRWGILYTHSQSLGKGWQGFMNYNQVSDDRYFRELTPNLAQTSLTNLSQQGGVTYNGRLGSDGTISFTGFAQRFQTLQDPFAAIVSPYDRLPHFSFNAVKYNIGKLDFEVHGSWTNFYHPTLVDGNRTIFYPTVSAPLRNEYGYITPKVGLHYTHYNLAAPIDTKGENIDRAVPIVSLDSGIAFDRQIELSDRKFIQTLEPRVFYTYIPHRNQSFLPNFDSAVNDFSFAQMFTENRFSGGDRINDANRVMVGLTSRFIEQQTGIEHLRLAIGQQFNFHDPRVLILGTQQVTSGRSDFIAAISGRLTPHLSTDSNIQMDESKLWIEKIRTGISYQPEPGKVLNFGYRFTRNIFNPLAQASQANAFALEQVDSSIQWPISGNWHGVARVNYSLQDDKILAGLAGLEYNTCCWAFRVVMQRLTTATQTTTTAFFVQLELKGLMGIGNNPLQVLQSSIPGYTSVH